MERDYKVEVEELTRIRDLLQKERNVYLSTLRTIAKADLFAVPDRVRSYALAAIYDGEDMKEIGHARAP